MCPFTLLVSPFTFLMFLKFLLESKISCYPLETYQRDFEGTGRNDADGLSLYDIKLDKAVEQYALDDSITSSGYSELSLAYDPEQDTFTFSLLPYDVVLTN